MGSLLNHASFFILTYDTSKEIQKDACKAASCNNSTNYLHGDQVRGIQQPKRT
jgi:hypothetical protein